LKEAPDVFASPFVAKSVGELVRANFIKTSEKTPRIYAGDESAATLPKAAFVG